MAGLGFGLNSESLGVGVCHVIVVGKHHFSGIHRILEALLKDGRVPGLSILVTILG
jgi:hypothetical protein